MDKSAAQPSKLTYLSPDLIHRNPDNPRIIFDDKSLKLLRESIKKVNILVPLIVYRSDADSKYYLLDGERRWRCAQDLGLDVVPVNIIAEPDMVTNILTMFNIHNVRENWELTPTALKLETLMRLLKEKDDYKVAALTGLTPFNVRRCKTVLKFNRRYLDMTLIEDTPNKVTGDFFVELYPALQLIEKNLPNVSKKYNNETIIDSMLEKYREKAITAITEFRKLAATIRLVNKGVSVARIEQAIEALISKPKVGITETYNETAEGFYKVREIIKVSTRLQDSLQDLDIGKIENRRELISNLQKLRNLIDRLLPVIAKKAR